jgi:hypothetical protein
MSRSSSRHADDAPSRSSTRSSRPSAQDDRNEGEGNRTAARRFNESEQAFAASGRVKRAARDARPRSDDEAADMDRAEQAGRSHARDEDPAVRGANEIHERESSGRDRERER